MNSKRKAIIERIERIERAIVIARDYLESGTNADWKGFRPLFDRKFKDGKELPPHKDWVKNVYLPSMEKALIRAERMLYKLDCVEKS
jgi:hypothetical protein